MKLIKSFFAILIFLFFAATAASATTNAEIYNKGNDEYSKGNYEEALKLYNSINISNSDIEYNRATAYFQLGDLGNAALGFYRANRLLPKDGDTKENLKLINTTKTDREPSDTDNIFIEAGRLAIDYLELDTMLWLCVGIYLVITLLVCTLLLTMDGAVKSVIVRLAIGLGLAFMILAGLTGFRIHDFERDDIAVIVAREAPIHAEPSTGSKELFKLHAGTRVETSRVEGNYVFIKVSTGFSGWVDRSTIVIIWHKSPAI